MIRRNDGMIGGIADTPGRTNQLQLNTAKMHKPEMTRQGQAAPLGRFDQDFPTAAL